MSCPRSILSERGDVVLVWRRAESRNYDILWGVFVEVAHGRKLAMQETNQSASARQPFVVDERIRKMIAGAVAEVDPAQIAVLRRLTPAERCRQAIAMIEGAERVAAYRARHRQPELTESQAIVTVRQRALTFREQMEEQWRKNR